MKFDALRWLLKHLKHHFKSLLYSWHGNRSLMRFMSTCMRDWCPSALAVSGTPREPSEEAAHTSRLEFCFAFSPIPSNAGQECVDTGPHSKSAHSQVSAAL